MRMRTLFSLTVIAVLIAPTFPVDSVFAVQDGYIEKSFQSPIDAFSVRMTDTSFQYSSKTASGWSPWDTYQDDGDNESGTESELLMMPPGVTSLRIRGIADASRIHPIIVSHEPVKTRLASIASVSLPGIVSRSDWGAEEGYLFEAAVAPEPVGDTAKGDSGDSKALVTQRTKDCQKAQQEYPSEFSIASTVTKDGQGRRYRWPLQYSKDVKLLVVHHSALVVQDDPRPAVERVRALYKYHAMTQGWGDIGYNFLIDEDGTVYEGRLGGKFAVGGHAYCNNVGTIGVVMMGNFEIEQPADAQVKSLQRLLASLANDYHIDTTKSVQFHGKKFHSPIVRHRDVLSTLCPGYYMSEAFGQVVKNVQTAHLNASVVFPKKTSSSSSSAPATIQTSSQDQKIASGISFTGRTGVSINPGGVQRLSFSFTANESGAYEGKKVAEVRLSDPRIKLWLDDGIARIPVTKGILLQSDVPALETIDVQLIVQAPIDAGTYSMDIGGIHFTISVFGRRARSGDFINPFSGNPALIVEPRSAPKSTALTPRFRPQSRMTSQVSSSASHAAAVSSGTPSSSQESQLLRIRLSASASPSVIFSDSGLLDTLLVSGGTTFDLLPRGSECEVRRRGERVLSAPVIKFSSSVSGILTVSGIAGKTRSYRGVLECRVVNGVVAVINELSLEEYMFGLAEEPDSEPYEKQRAFAIAARTYAAYYTDSANRKFPGMPYDGSDDPAFFQSYAGVDFAGPNPHWVRAVKSTEGEILTFGGRIIKPPYFSSDDGQTRTPLQAGWKNFPFAEIFSSKPDPWCEGLTLRGHGVGMSGCGALGQAKEGRSAEQILLYYYPGTRITQY